jgi:hypothetical protein
VIIYTDTISRESVKFHYEQFYDIKIGEIIFVATEKKSKKHKLSFSLSLNMIYFKYIMQLLWSNRYFSPIYCQIIYSDNNLCIERPFRRAAEIVSFEHKGCDSYPSAWTTRGSRLIST